MNMEISPTILVFLSYIKERKKEEDSTGLNRVKVPLPSDLYWALRDFLQRWDKSATRNTVRWRGLCFSLCLEDVV